MYLGIDFGTTFSSAALFVNGEIKRVKEPMRSGYSYPSSAFVNKEGKVFVGQAAENQRGQDPSSYRREFKRDLGQKTPSSLGNRKFLPEDLVSEMLKVLKREAEEMVNRQRIESAIVTIPASYAGYRAELMEQAARDAGFKQVQLLPEPVAAAIYYDRGQPLADGERLLVYDLGGGTFDAALMEKRGDRFELLAQPVGDERLGGSDFDTAIYNHLRQNCSQTLSQLLDPSQRDARAIRTRLKVVDWLRDFKHQLSVVEVHTDDLPIGDFDVYTLSRSTFQGLIHQQLQTTVDLCDRLVRDAGLTWSQVGKVLLVGGSCRIPYVRQLLEKRFNCNVVRVDEPELAVCLGAAIYQDVITSKRMEAERLRQEAQERERIKAEQERQRLEAMLQKERQQRIEAEQERQRVETEKKSGEKSFQFEVVLLDKRGNINNREQKESRYQWIYLGDGVSLDMVYIPGGSFMMGSPVRGKFLGLLRSDEDAGRDNERPQHLVTLPPFQMGKYPVTQSQYQAIMGENPSYRQGADLPVENVSWLDAQDFCEKLSQKTGKKFRLPSEAEWEYACRAGTNTDFHFGETITTKVANFGGYPFGGAPESYGPHENTAVGSYRVANNFGLYDMHGNVEEWCLDEWTTDYQGASVNGSTRGDIFSLDGNKERIKRGGSWNSTAWLSRSAHRSTWTASDNCMWIGFRVLSPKS